MSVEAVAVGDAPEAGPESTYVVSRGSAPQYIAGRRDFLKYREMGVTEATGGQLRAQITSASTGLSEPTGWHYHVCETQFVYMLSGWVDLAFGDGETVRIEAGDSIVIPGGLPHNETATSDSFELLEVSLPADMGTEVCDPPAG